MKFLTLPRLVVTITFISLFAMAVRTPVDSDMWWHVRTGQLIIETRGVPLTDPFSHTQAGRPWIDHSWLAQVALYAAYAIGSFPALAILVAALVVTAFAFVWQQMDGGALSRAFILVLAAIASAVIWAPRPQMFTFALTAVAGCVVSLYKWRQIDRLWLLPPLFVLWANLHGGFAVGFLLLAASIAGEVVNHALGHAGPEVLSWRRIGKLVLITVACYALLILNPNTTAMYTYPFRTVGIGALRDVIEEWSSPDFHAIFAQPFIWLLIATLAAVGWSGRRLDGGDFALIAVFAYSALLARRNIAPFALVAAPALARHAQAMLQKIHWRPDRPSWRGRVAPEAISTGTSLVMASPPPAARHDFAKAPAINWIILIVVVMLAALKVIAPVLPSIREQAERDLLPRDAVDWVEANRPAGPMFNAYNWGGYLIWRLWPDVSVYIDGRTDLYDDAFLREYLDVAAARPGFEAVLDRQNIEWVFIEAESALDVALSREAGWSAAYRDPQAAIFVREGRP